MDPRLLASLGWGIGLTVTVTVAVLAVVLVRRRLGPGADAASPPSSALPDWITLLTGLQSNRLETKPWIGWAPLLVARVRACPPPLRAPLIIALERAISQCRDPLVSASMVQVRAALAALSAA